MDFTIVNVISLLSSLGIIMLSKSFISGLIVLSGFAFIIKCILAFIIFVVCTRKNRNKTDNLEAYSKTV